MSHNLIESYSWMAPQWKVADQSPKKIRIRGPALFAFEKFFKKGISGNQRKYIQDEIMRSARTLRNVPIDVNHEISLWEEKTGHNWNTYRGSKPHAKGHSMWGEEEGGIIEYVAEINDPIYRQKIIDTIKTRNKEMTVEEYQTKWGKLPLQGVSVDADFLHLRCKECGDDKRYFDLNEYKNHMWDVHFIKNFEIEPRGISFKRLSLVEPPEKPGVEGAGFELVETQMGMHKMYEALLQDAAIYHPPIVDEGNPYQSYIPEKGLTQKQEITEMKEEKKELRRFAISPNTRVAFDPRADYDFTMKEQDMAGDDGPPAETKECPVGQHWDAETQQCVPDVAGAPDVAVTEQEDHGCEEGYHWDAEENKCVPNEAPAVTEQEHVCPEDFHWDEALQNCVADEPPTAVVVPQIPTGETMRLGEPFADYTSFEDCVAKNSDKEDPEAYCASIKKEVEETKIRRIVREELAKHTETLAEKQLREKQQLNAKQRDELLKAQIKKLEEATKGFNVAHVQSALKEIKALKKSDANLRGQILGLGTIQKATVAVVKSIQETKEHTHPEIGKLTIDLKTLSGKQILDTSAWKNITGSINTIMTGLDSKIDMTTSELNTKMTELATNAVKPQTLQEMLPTDITKRLENVETFIEGYRATATGKFKGNPPPTKQSVDYENPDNPHTDY